MPRPPRHALVDATELELAPLPVPGRRDLGAALAALVHWADSRHVRDDVRRAAGFPGEDLLEFLAVNQLTLRGPLRPTELADALQTSRPNLSKVARRLEVLGLAARTADPADDRGVLLALTPAGRDVGRRILEHGRRTLEEALRGWSTADVDTFEALFARFVTDLTPAADDPVRSGFAYPPPRTHRPKGSDDDVRPPGDRPVDRPVDRPRGTPRPAAGQPGRA